MKKLFIANNNMKVGGIQKSLYNLLWTIHGQYEITLYLFRKIGAYVDQLPPDIKIVECKSLFRYLGVSQGECKGKLYDTLMRGVLAALCRLFGRPAVMRLLLASQKTLPETYDCAISYMHNGNRNSFYGGVQDFVLRRVKAKKKIAFLHCDYRNCGADHRENNRDMAAFDRIAACSDGCREAFLQVLPELAEKCLTVKNCHRQDEIRGLAEQDPVVYEKARVNVITVARLAHEKGVERAIIAAAYAVQNGAAVKLHIVGDGAMMQTLQDMSRELQMEENICFYGEKSNPYPYMAAADLFLLTSYHEAAPMVIEESVCLGVPVLTVQTTSSKDMVTDPGYGWVCGNDQDALNRMLCNVLLDRTALDQIKQKLRNCSSDNQMAMEQFAQVIEN